MKPKFTHLAELYGFRCYYNIDTHEVQDTNWFNEKMIALFVWIDTTFHISDEFRIVIIKKLKP